MTEDTGMSCQESDGAALSLSRVSPDLLPLVEQFEPLTPPAETLHAARSKAIEMVAGMAPANFAGVECQDFLIPSRFADHQIRVRALWPAGSSGPLPTVLHIHGGGMVLGTPEMTDPQNADLAREFGLSVVSVDYRLAPEVVAPGNVEDCYSALAWLHDDANADRFDVRRIALVGESAGGGLAASLALLARDRGEFAIAFQCLNAPMLDDRTGADSARSDIYGHYIWRPEDNRFGWQALLGNAFGSDDVSPYWAAARATDLSDLPSTFISVGALDLFFRENLDFALRLADAGVPLELHVYPGAYHGFQMSSEAATTLQANHNFTRAIARFIKNTE